MATAASAAPAIASATAVTSDCIRDENLQATRSRELQTILQEDQDARKARASPHQPLHEEFAAMARDDLKRRRRVAEIFAKGCFVSAADFAAAALVFQHGTVPEHYLQAFVWAKRAVELGDSTSKSLMGVSIDRYLVATGRAQLFGSQARKMKGTDCYCMPQVEFTFPDEMRRQYTGESLAEKQAWVASLNTGKTCSTEPCPDKLTPSPRGTVPGFW